MPPKNEEKPVVPPTNVDPATPPAGNPPAVPAQPGAPLQNGEPAVPPVVPPVEPPKKLSKRERLEFARTKIEEQLDELDTEDDDDKVVTHGDLKRMKQQDTKQTALTMAEAIENADERAEVIEILESRILPSDDPAADLKLARAMVNGVKTQQQLEEQARGGKPANHANTPANPGNTPDAFTPTDQETIFMRPPYNLSQEDIIKSRQKTAAAQ